MDVVELKVLTEDDGIAYHIEHGTLDIESIKNTTLADMIADAKELIEEINRLMNEIIEEIRNDCGDNCDCNGVE